MKCCALGKCQENHSEIPCHTYQIEKQKLKLDSTKWTACGFSGILHCGSKNWEVSLNKA